MFNLIAVTFILQKHTHWAVFSIVVLLLITLMGCSDDRLAKKNILPEIEQTKGTDRVAIFFLGGQSNASAGHAFVNELGQTDNFSRSNFYINIESGLAKYNPFVNPNINLSAKENFGIEKSLGDYLRTLFKEVVVIKYHRGGIGVFEDPEEIDFNVNSTGEAHDQMIERFDAGIAATRAMIPDAELTNLGYIWIHGETDASNSTFAKAYYQNLKALEKSLRSRYDSIGRETTTPVFVLTEMSNRRLKDQSIVSDAMIDIVNESINGCYIVTQDLSKSDGSHYDAAGIQELGVRLGQCF